MKINDMKTFYVTHELKVHVRHRVRASSEDDAKRYATSKALHKAVAIERRHGCNVKAAEAVEVTGAFAEFSVLL